MSLADTFTDTNGTALTAHTRDVPDYETWYDQGAGGTAASINTNRARGAGTGAALYICTDSIGGVSPTFLTGYVPPAYWAEATFYRRATTTGVATNELSEAIGVAASGQYNGDTTGYFFGWNETDDTWYLKDSNLDSGGFLTQIDLASSTTGAFTGTAQSRVLRVEINFVEAYPNYSLMETHIECFVDGVSVISWSSGAGGAQHREDYDGNLGYGLLFSQSGSVDIDSIFGGDFSVHIVGNLADTSPGVVSPFWYPVPGAYLAGHQTTLALGTITPGSAGDVVVSLTGFAVTTDAGVLGIQLGVGVTSFSGTLRPTLAASNIYGAAVYADHVESAYFLLDGVPRGIAEQRIGSGVNGFGAFETEASRFLVTLAVDIGINTLNFFPRPVEDHTYGYNASYLPGGMFSVDASGVRQSAHYRSTPYTNAFFNVFPQCVPHYMAWAAWGAPNIYGPELFLGGGNESGEAIEQRSYAGLGIYARSATDVVAFHTSRVNPAIGGVTARLVGGRAELRALSDPTGFAGVAGGAGAASLPGARVTALGGSLGVDGVRALTGRRLTTNYPESYRVVPVSSDDQLALSISTASYADDAFVPVAQSHTTSTGRVYPKPNVLCVVPTGHANVIYAVYINEPPEAAAPYVGLVVYDLAARTILAHSNTVAGSPVDSTAGTVGFTQPRQERTVAEVVALSNGTSVTQFLIDRHIVHLSWTSGTVTAPTITIKTPPAVAGAGGSPPERIIQGWESLAHRGDSAYHILYRYTYHASATTRGYESISKVYVNDATSAGSTWALVEASNSGGTSGPSGWSEQYVAPTSDGTHNQGTNFSAFDANQAWLRTHRNYARGDSSDGDIATIAVDFWGTTYPLLSVAAKSHVGSVRVVLTPYTALTGLSAVTGQGGFNGIAAGADRTVNVAGLNPSLHKYRATTGAGICAPVRITFLTDTFTDTGTVSLQDHISDNGVSWIRFGVSLRDLEVAGGEVSMGFDSVSTFQSTYQAVCDSPRRDYKVSFQHAPGILSFYTPGEPELAVGVRCPANSTEGYYFGYNRGDDLWYLTKFGGLPYPEVSATLATYSDTGLTGDYSIEVSGDYDVRIICRKGPVTIIDYTDAVHHGGYRTLVDGYRINIHGQLPDDAMGPSFSSINASYYEPGAFIIDGLRATTAQGILTGPWLVGERATTAAGLLSIAPLTDVALTGLPAVATPGTVYTNEVVLVGYAATTAQGVLGIGGDVSLTLLGQRGDGFAGVLAPLTRLLPGLAALIIRGDVTPHSESFASLLGAAVVPTPGAFTPAIALGLLGNATGSAAGAVGTGIALKLTPAGATTNAGVMTTATAVSVPLVGAGVSATGGFLTASASTTEGVTGGTSTTGAGVLTPTILVAATGARGGAAAGVLVPLCVVDAQGQAAVSAQGVLQVLLDIALTGHATVATAGVVSYQYGCTLFPTGVFAEGAVGYVAPVLPNASTLLWVTSRPEAHTARSEDEELY